MAGYGCLLVSLPRPNQYFYTQRACAARVTVVVLSVCLSVCLSARRTTGYEAANEWHHRVVNNEKIDINVAIFPKCHGVKTSEKAYASDPWRVRLPERALHRACAYEGDTVCGSMRIC